VPSNVTVPVITPGPLAVSVGAALDAGLAPLDGWPEPPPQAATMIEVMMTQSVVRIREAMENDYIRGLAPLVV
jgi:hypothetical protein